MPMIGDDFMVSGLTKALDGLAARQRAIAQNVANLETPNYRAKTVAFEDSLESAMASGDDASMRQARITYDESTAPANLQGNNVQLDKETIALEDTSLKFQLLTQAVSDRFRLLRTVMKREL